MPKPAWASASSARTGPCYHHGSLAYYACEGLIAVHDARDDSYVAVSPTDFEQRAKALATMLGTAPSDGNASIRQLYRDLKRVIQEMHECIKQARFMGDPGNPKVREFWARHRPGHKSTVSLSAGSNPEAYPDLPEVPLGQYTGRTTAVGVEVPKPLGIYSPPRRKNRSGILLPSDAL